jgi:hypothetical protein
MDSGGLLVGYIDIPDPASRRITLGKREFVVVSRSTINGQYEPEPDALGKSQILKRILFYNTPLEYQMETQADFENYRPITKPNTTNAIGNFDTGTYPEDRPWCMFNVMMITRPSRLTSPAYRDAIGRIHVDAFLEHHSGEKIIDLE